MKKFVIGLALILAAVSCDRKPEFVILHVNDTHSHLEPIRSGKYDGQGGAVERAAIVDSIREAEGENRVLLLHAGDFNQGTSYFSELGGDLEVDVVNALRYDCLTLGNHEFDNDIEDLCRRVKNIECPVVCANLDLRSFELGSYVKPYAIIEKAGRKIGIIGMEADISTAVAKKVSSRIPVFDNTEVVNRYAAEVRAKGCDLVILLSHLGYDEDQKLIPSVRGIDIVIGGHSHTKVDDLIYVKDLDGHPVPVVTAWCHGKEIGKVTVW